MINTLGVHGFTNTRMPHISHIAIKTPVVNNISLVDDGVVTI